MLSQKLQKSWSQSKANHGVYLLLPANQHSVIISLGIFGPQMLEGRLVIFRVILKFEEVNLFVLSKLTSLHKVS